jgi:hypothetical protein
VLATRGGSPQPPAAKPRITLVERGARARQEAQNLAAWLRHYSR